MTWNLGDPTARDDWRAEHLPSDRKRKITKEERAERERMCLGAVEAVTRRECERRAELGLSWAHWRGVSAADVAAYLNVAPAQRLGNGAVKGSWSGTMPAANRVSQMLRSMHKRGLLDGEHGHDGDYRFRYWLPGQAPWDLRPVLRGEQTWEEFIGGA